jgi:hypothetical protein
VNDRGLRFSSALQGRLAARRGSAIQS